MPAKLKWKKNATPEEIARVKEIDQWIVQTVLATVRVKIKRLKAERRVIIMRCLVRDHRRRKPK